MELPVVVLQKSLVDGGPDGSTPTLKLVNKQHWKEIKKNNERNKESFVYKSIKKTYYWGSQEAPFYM